MEAHQKTLSTADKADMNAIYKNIEEIGEVKTEIAKVQAKEHQDVRNLLTEEQLLSFDNSRGKRFQGDMRRTGMNRMNQPERFGRRPFDRTK
jgi:Spy/CpxP family protein refolding chaperone